jgi:hypothetical protein
LAEPKRSRLVELGEPRLGDVGQLVPQDLRPEQARRRLDGARALIARFGGSDAASAKPGQR